MENQSWLVPIWNAVKLTVGILVLVWIVYGTFKTLLRDLRLFSERRGRMERRLRTARSDSRPPFLLLRSFFEKNLQSVYHLDTSIKDTLLYVLRFEERPSVDFIVQLSQAVASHGPLLAIGGKEIEEPALSKHRNVAFVESSERDWEFLFLTIARASRAIFVLPARTAGILKEVSNLRALGLTGKAIVFMPPAAWPTGPSQKALTEILGAEWTEIRARWMLEGLRSPDYVGKGMLYIPNADFSIKHSCLLDSTMRPLESSLGLLLPKLDGTHSSTADVLLNIDR